MSRQRIPIFQAGNKVIFRYGAVDQIGRVSMGSAKERSLFIELPDGLTVTILGLPRPKEKKLGRASG